MIRFICIITILCSAYSTKIPPFIAFKVSYDDNSYFYYSELYYPNKDQFLYCISNDDYTKIEKWHESDFDYELQKKVSDIGFVDGVERYMHIPSASLVIDSVADKAVFKDASYLLQTASEIIKYNKYYTEEKNERLKLANKYNVLKIVMNDFKIKDKLETIDPLYSHYTLTTKNGDVYIIQDIIFYSSYGKLCVTSLIINDKLIYYFPTLPYDC